MRAAAKEETFHPHAGLLAWLAQNSHPGHQLQNTTFRPGITLPISNTATSFHDPLYDFRGGPRCTGQYRDVETGNDWFNIRHMSGAQGRFQSVDPANAGANAADPQTWNAYAYVGNNPLSYTDPSGMVEEAGGGGGGAFGAFAGLILTGFEDLFKLFGGGGSPPPAKPVPWADVVPTWSITGWGAAASISGTGPLAIPGLMFFAQATSSAATGVPAPSNVTLTPQAQGCQAKIQGAVNNALNTNSTFLGPTSGSGMNPMGYRNGAYNFNYFAPGVVNPVAGSTNGSGRFPGSGLHIPLPGGADPTISPWGYNAAAGGSYFTAHFDSANPTDDLVGVLIHFFDDVLLRRPHGC